MGDTLVAWSGGKDSALALHLAAVHAPVTGLLTTSGPDQRIPIHGVHRELIDAQAAALGLPVLHVELPTACPDDVYAQRLAAALRAPSAPDAAVVISGDVHLADVRAYREAVWAGAGVRGRFPLWGLDSATVAARVLRAGIDAVVCAVDTTQLPGCFTGRRYDAELLAELPPGVDPCGEGGEFHTFVTDGPGFASPVDVEVIEVDSRGRFAQARLRRVTP